MMNHTNNMIDDDDRNKRQKCHNDTNEESILIANEVTTPPPEHVQDHIDLHQLRERQQQDQQQHDQDHDQDQQHEQQQEVLSSEDDHTDADAATTNITDADAMTNITIDDNTIQQTNNSNNKKQHDDHDIKNKTNIRNNKVNQSLLLSNEEAQSTMKKEGKKTMTTTLTCPICYRDCVIESDNDDDKKVKPLQKCVDVIDDNKMTAIIRPEEVTVATTSTKTFDGNDINGNISETDQEVMSSSSSCCPFVCNPYCHHVFCLSCIDHLLLGAAASTSTSLADNKSIVTTTLGHCPICRTVISYFDLKYCHNQQNVITNNNDNDNEWWNMFPKDNDNNNNHDNDCFTSTTVVPPSRETTVYSIISPSTSSSTSSSSFYEVDLSDDDDFDDDDDDDDDDDEEEENHDRRHMQPGSSSNNNNENNHHGGVGTAEAVATASNKTKESNYGIGFGSIHFPTTTQQSSSRTKSNQKESMIHDRNNNNHNIPYLNVTKLFNLNEKDTTKRTKDLIANSSLLSLYKEFLCFVHNDIHYFRNIKYHPFTRTFQGDIYLLSSSSHVNNNDILESSSSLLSSNNFLRFILTFSDNWNCIARGVVIVQLNDNCKTMTLNRSDSGTVSIGIQTIKDPTATNKQSSSDKNQTIQLDKVKQVIRLGGTTANGRRVYRRLILESGKSSSSSKGKPNINSTNEQTAVTDPATTTVTTLSSESSSSSIIHSSPTNSNEQQYNHNDLWGNVFCQALQIGLASYHFINEMEAYVSYEHNNASTSWPPLDNGRPIPSRVYFRDVIYNPTNCTFHGTINWYNDYQTTWQGIMKWEYYMKFDTNYMTILNGHVNSVVASSSSDDDNNNNNSTTTIAETSLFGVSLIYCNAALFDHFCIMQLQQQHSSTTVSTTTTTTTTTEIDDNNNDSPHSTRMLHLLSVLEANHTESNNNNINANQTTSVVTESNNNNNNNNNGDSGIESNNTTTNNTAITNSSSSSTDINNDNFNDGNNHRFMISQERVSHQQHHHFRVSSTWQKQTFTKCHIYHTLKSEGLPIRNLALLDHVWRASQRFPRKNPIDQI